MFPCRCRKWWQEDRNNVNVISWLLTDYRQEKAAAMPELLDQEGQPLESDEECSGAVEKGWGILLK